MRIAVCTSGQQRLLTRFTRKQHEHSMKNAFGFADVDYYYHTWSNSVLYEYKNMIIQQEPAIDYHPVHDTKADGGDSLAERRRLGLKQDKLRDASKQILAHSSLMKVLKNSYDLIVRCRWDLYFSNKVDYKSIAQQAYDIGPVGMGYPRYDRDFLDNPVLQEANENNPRWNKMISPDNLIMHRPELWNTNYVDELHDQKNLLPAEWGWYQVLCRETGNSHITYKGGVVCTAGRAGGWRP